MAIDKDLNVSPYFDDFDEEKNFHRILFKPAVAIQARELTQLQTILQNQIERFGNNILREGSIIEGCNFVEVENLGYIKILDLQTNGQSVSMNNYRNTKLIGISTGIEAVVEQVATGLQTQSPNLNTLFVKYIKSGNSEEKVFSDTENIEVRNQDTNELIATVTAAGSVESSSVGFGYATRVGEGIIYQKGFFVRVEPQIVVVSKYTNEPDDLVVGFETREDIINSNNDTSLLDNANGFNNFNAPGADRLKLTAQLVTKTLAEAKVDERFFSIQEYNRGKIVRRNPTTRYDNIMVEMERRTKEESGNYVVKTFPVNVEQNAANNEVLDVLIGAGKAYVEGKRVELYNTFDIQIDKSIDFNTQESQSFATNIGQYILVDQYMGNFDFNNAVTIDLYDTVQLAANSAAVPVTPTGTKIGEAKIRSLIYEQGVVGTETAQYRAYIFDVKMNSNTNFTDVKSIYYAGTGSNDDGVADLVNTTIFEPNFASSIFTVGKIGIKALPAVGTNADFIYRTVNKNLTINGSAGTMTINLTEGTWPYTGTLNNTQKSEIFLVSQENQSPYIESQPIDLSSVTVTVSGSTMSFSGLDTTSGADVSVIAHYNVKETVSQPAKKDFETIYVKIDCSNNASNTSIGDYSLGVPDVYEVENIFVGNTYSESNADRKNDFYFSTGQTDVYYGLSRIRKKKSVTLTTSDRILVKAKVFRKNTSGIYGDGFFTVNSYPIDDANTANTAAITTEQIPVYTSESGSEIDLRNVIDFRPYAANTAAYAVNTSAATINPSFTLGFGTTELYIPTPNEQFESDYEYYLSRKDLIMINEDGEFTSLRGTPGENPTPPSNPDVGMVIASVNIPVYPSLPKRQADLIGRSDLGVTLYKRKNKRYTMKDIGGIDQRLKNIEYYTTLNALELESKDLLITDAAGNNRFKNGIFVDSFRDLGAAAVKNPAFSAAIDQSYQEITPRFKAYSFDIKPVGTWNNVTEYADVATLNIASESAMIEQPYATNVRNCVTDFYKFKAQGQLYPEYDGAYDTTQAPALNLDVDLVTPFTEFTEQLAEIIPLSNVAEETVTAERLINTRVTPFTRQPRQRIDTVQQTINQNVEEFTVFEDTTTEQVGNFITDFRFLPFLRSRQVRISLFGLRPDTTHYFFFDGKSIDQHVAPAAYAIGSTNLPDIERTGEYGTAIKSNARGEILAIFLIPEETFYVGDRALEVIDVNDYESQDASTSYGKLMYRGFNFQVERTGISVSTRVPSFDADFETSRTITRNVTRTTWFDPIAQTFKVSDSESEDAVVMLNKIDTFFSRKDTNRGVTLQIRETQNGYPSTKLVPFSSVHLTPEDVNVTEDASIPTTFEFPAPVALKTDAEYAMVVLPDANTPEYLIHTSKAGGTDKITGLPVVQDSHDGVLFTSTNDSAWTPYQDENLKFTMYKSNFVDSGTAYFTNKDTEFLSIQDIQGGDFNTGERVFLLNANVDGTVSVSANSTTITGTGLSIFNTGDYIAYYANTSIIDTLRVTNVISDTELVVANNPRYANTSTSFFKTIVGDITYYDRNTPARMFIDNSSAKSGTYTYTDSANNELTVENYFVSNTVIQGETSKASATISSVDDFKLSYLQANILNSGFKHTRLSTSVDRIVDQTTRTDYAASSKIPVSFDSNTYFKQKPSIIKSKSLEILENTGDSFRLELNLSNASTGTIKDASPFVDFGASNIFVYEYQINNVIDDGTVSELDGGEVGPAESKYISKTVTLGEGFDADDLRVYLTAYRPNGTDVKVYVKFKNLTDPRPIEEIEWTEMSITALTNDFSTDAERFDYKELEYNLPVQAAVDFTEGAGAALNSDNSDIIRYISDTGVIYDRYKSYVIKIVLLGNSHQNVPRVRDLRAIALT